MAAIQHSVSPLFTPTEAAVLTRLPLKAVNNAIDKRTISAVTGSRDGRTTRLIGFRALVSLTLERRLADRFAPALRRQLFGALEQTARDRISLENGFLTIDLREPRRELAAALRSLRRVRDLVTTDPEIMGGEPVFRGTRVPVRLIAASLENATPSEDLLHDYPRLTAEMLRLAPSYVAAYPLRGRPKNQPWRDRPPLRTTRRKLSAAKGQ